MSLKNVARVPMVAGHRSHGHPALIVARPFDGAVLDANLRGEMAFSVTDALAERGLSFVFATGYPASGLPARYGSVIRCDKPVDAQKVVDLLFPVAG